MALFPVTANPLDDPFYYLNNFMQVLDWLEHRYADVLSVEEQQFIADCNRLPRESRALLVRIVMRKGIHFRLSKLHYAEIGDIARAAEPLLALGWIDEQLPLSIEALFEVLLKAEILQCLGSVIDHPKGKKTDWLPALSEQFPETKSFRDWCPTLDDRLFSLTIMSVCDRLRLMFSAIFTRTGPSLCWLTWAFLPTKKSSSVPTPEACAAVRTSTPACFCTSANNCSKPVRRWRALLSRSTD